MLDDRTKRLLDARLARDQAAERLPSIVAGLARDGEFAWAGGRGEVSGHRPDCDTQYRAGSITKTFVALCVMRLRDSGKLTLSDQLGEHLDVTGLGASAAVAAMTIGQLLSHSSGLRAETAGQWWERTAGSSLADLAAGSLSDDAARFAPGKRHHYSNVGYALLGALLAAKHGMGWYEVISRELLTPLGMTRTTLRPQPPHATGYAVHPYADVLLAEPEHDAGAMAPAGQLWTTVTDLARFAQLLSGQLDGIIAKETLAEMREPVVIVEATGQPWTSAYGLGLQLWNSAGHRYGHTGSMPGFMALLAIADAPGADTVIVACNSTAGYGMSLGADLLAILAEEEPYVPAEWKPTQVDADLLALLGSWFWGPAPYTLSLSGDELNLSRDGADGRGMRFRRDATGGWRGLDGYMAGEPLIAVAGSDGKVTALDVASFIYTRTPYDPAAPVPGGLPPDAWHGGSAR
ncbi:MAG TPA: serine hydrolase domain-containing protein [Streptosporangiaceae bacterium]|nr:serine hydrolase domain-containing protein [Streptosporangiaceae bacterium]